MLCRLEFMDTKKMIDIDEYVLPGDLYRGKLVVAVETKLNQATDYCKANVTINIYTLDVILTHANSMPGVPTIDRDVIFIDCGWGEPEITEMQLKAAFQHTLRRVKRE